MLLQQSMTWAEMLVKAGLGVSIVFVALIVLVLSFLAVSKITTMRVRKRMKDSGKEVENLKDSDLHMDAATTAAIAMALHLCLNNDIHDTESNVITIKQVDKRYSPWNSKIYGLNNLHR